jgi:hypothetical protein
MATEAARLKQKTSDKKKKNQLDTNRPSHGRTWLQRPNEDTLGTIFRAKSLTVTARLKGMAPTVHDNLLISYEVQCEARTIILRTEYRVKNEPTKSVNVIFTDVQGYHFENDAFGNIIFGFETVPVEHFLTEYGPEILESYHTTGAPGPWATNLETASAYLREQGIQAFILSSSCGLDGWVLARELSIVPA